MFVQGVPYFLPANMNLTADIERFIGHIQTISITETDRKTKGVRGVISDIRMDRLTKKSAEVGSRLKID